MNIGTELAKLLGPKGWLTEDLSAFGTDWLAHHSHPPLGVARPKSTAEVSALMRLAHDADVKVCPQGGNTSLCAGAVPACSNEIILSLSRMTKVTEIDLMGFTATMDAGVVLADLHQQLDPLDVIFPMHLGSEGTARIGGLISTNAGGSHALRYGMMQDLVLGLEVVLADGSVWTGTRGVMKDNAGYQLRRLFCGAEGTLGVITGVVLKLFPAPKSRTTALLSLPDFETAVHFGSILRRDLGEFISALEFFPKFGLDLTLKHISGLKWPLSNSSGVNVLVELSTSSANIILPDLLDTALEAAFEDELLVDGTVAANEAQRAVFWKFREEIPEGQRLEGSQLKHDISVPPNLLGQFIENASAELDKILPGVRINPFGHLGDGNIHFNLSPPEGNSDFSGKNHELSELIYARAEQMGGSFAAEHGLGRTKTTYADQLRSTAERALMTSIKFALDPKNILNPGVLISTKPTECDS